MIKKGLLIILCGLAAFGNVALASGPAQKGSPKIQLDSTDFQEIDAMMNRALDLFDVPGAALGIIVDGEVLFSKGYGYRDKAKGAPVDENTIFAVGSCTKAFTSFVLGQLVDEGAISWDDPVIKYIPELHLYDQYATYELTIRDLLAHRSGLPRHDLSWYNSPCSRDEIINRLQYLPPNCGLREKFQYNNLMYTVAGVVIERVTGLSWEEAVKSRILLPLGMTRSNFSVEDTQKSDNFSLPYMKKNGVVQPIAFRNVCNGAPAAAINSSLTDMMKWAKLHLSDGTLDQSHFINKRTLQEMHTLQIASSDYPQETLFTLGYGLGWFIGMYKGEYFVQHGGYVDGFISDVALLPQKGVAIVILTNCMTEGYFVAESMIKSVADKLLKNENEDWLSEIKRKYDEIKLAEKEKEDSTQSKGSPSHPLSDYVGRFSNPGFDTIEVYMEKDQLTLFFNRLAFPLAHKCYDTFVATKECQDKMVFPIDFNFSFITNPSGEISELRIPFEETLPPIVFKREAESELTSRTYLKQFDGLYQGALGAFTVQLNGDHLVAVIPGYPTYELIPEKAFAFSVKGLQGFAVRFEKDSSGRVTEVVINYAHAVYRFKKLIL